MATSTESVTRTLPILIPLIKEQLNQGRIASEEAGLPYYRKVGEMLHEARIQIEGESWGRWLDRNFSLSQKTARTYMDLAHHYEIQEAVTDERDTKSARAPYQQGRDFRTLSEFTEPERHPGHRPAWHDPVKAAFNQVNFKRLEQQRMEIHKEQQLVRGLALQIVDIGYKVLATKLHPDKGGTREGMQRLNQARNLLKKYI